MKNFFEVTEIEKNNKKEEKEQLLKEEFSLKRLIKNSEERVIIYKKLIEEVYKNKDKFPPQDEFIVWYKQDLRENLNSEQKWLKQLILQRTHEKEGLNPPGCYNF